MKGKKIKKAIEKKFNSPVEKLELKEVSGTRDHFMYELYYNKEYMTLFQISRGSREFGQTLEGLMSRQLGISISQLKGIVSCTFWGKDWIAKSKLLTS